MNPISIPDEAKRGRFWCKPVSMGPPPGVNDDDCGTVEMLIADHADHPGIGRGQYAYFRPTPAELEILNAGGFIEFAQYGDVVQPFGAAVWSVAPDVSS